MDRFFRVLAYGRPYWFRLLVGLALVVALTGTGLVFPQVIGFLIDNILPPKATAGAATAAWASRETTLSALGVTLRLTGTQWLLTASLFLISLYVLRGVLGYGQTYLVRWVGQRVIFDVRNQIYGRLQELPLRFYEQRGTGQIMARMTGDVDAIGGLVTTSSADLVTNVVVAVASVGILVHMNWKLALISFVVLPLFALNYRTFIKHIGRYYRDLRRKWAELYGEMHESIAGAQVVKAFGQEKYEARSLFRGLRDTYGFNIRLAQFSTMMGSIGNLLAASGTAIILLFGGLAVFRGEMTTGDIVKFYSYLAYLYSPIIALTNMNDVIQRAMISADRVFDILDARSTVQDAPNAKPLPRVEGQVDFDDVTFAYDPEKVVLHEVSFVAEPGQMIALVGPSGSGKTTIANLIPRFYDPSQGVVAIDGHDIRKVTLRSLRGQIGVVLQENVLFSGSVRDNLRYGKMDASDQEIVAASIAANAHQFITEEMPEGYDTEVGERGLRLSGGQKQRIAIARAILRDPRILILDEATSSLDSEAEAQIQEALQRLMQGRTTFVIAHRLSTIMRADRILVLEEGRIIESGTHAELLARDGRYAEMYHTQFRTEELRRAWSRGAQEGEAEREPDQEPAPQVGPVPGV
jgi:subfamily B ATP-binding cassette protein MsbA